MIVCINSKIIKKNYNFIFALPFSYYVIYVFRKGGKKLVLSTAKLKSDLSWL